MRAAFRSTAKTEYLREDRSQARAPVIEIATDNRGRLPGEISKLMGVSQQANLLLALSLRKPEVKVEDLDDVCLVLRGFRAKGGVLASASLSTSDREVDISLPQDREPA